MQELRPGRASFLKSHMFPKSGSDWKCRYHDGLKIAYSLRIDEEPIRRVQRATTTTEEFGIEPTHGLLGSGEWWNRIAAGDLAGADDE